MFQLKKEKLPKGFSKSQIAALNEKSNRQESNIKQNSVRYGFSCYEDKRYQRRKTHLKNRLYKTYDKIDEAEELLVSAKAKKRFWDNDTQNETVCSLVHTKNSEIEITTKRGL